MRPVTVVKVLGTAVMVVALVLAGGPAMAGGSGGSGGWGPPRPKPLTCTGGDVASGTYASLTVTGSCSVPADAVITVTGGVFVAPGAQLDAQTAPSTITVGRGVTAARGSFVGLGCQPPALTGNSGHVCTVEPDGHSIITVNGDITATGAQVFLLNGATVKGNVTFIGGGSQTIPWSIKNNTINGNLTVLGQTTLWLGVMFNKVGRNVTLVHIAVTDPDPGAPGAYIVRNNVGSNLVCTGITPGVSGGFIPGEVNVVGGHAVGQCAALV